MRPLIFWMFVVAGLIVNHSAPASAAKEEVSLKIPNGYVVMVSLFDTGQSGQMSVTYNLGIIIDEHTILSARRTVMAHRGDDSQAMLAYRIIVLTADLKVLSGKTYDYVSDSQAATITTVKEDVLPTDPLIAPTYSYSPNPDDQLTGLLLVSKVGEPLRIAHLTLEPLAIAQSPVELDGFSMNPFEGSYYPLRIVTDTSAALPIQEIHGGFVLKDGLIVGLLLERNYDDALFLVPLVLPGPQ